MRSIIVSRKKVSVLDVAINIITMNDAIDVIIDDFLKSDEIHLIATANAEMVMMANQDKELQAILNSADLVVPDGAGVVWASNKLGYPMKERVAGYDLVQHLLNKLKNGKESFYFLGSSPGVAEKAKVYAETKYPGVKIVGTHDGYFSVEEEKMVVQEIQKLRPDILLVALGVPRQEKWIKKHFSELNVPVTIGVGGTLDVMAGVVKRAPLWMQKAKLEWLYRGMLQPKRICRLIALPKFVIKVLQNKKY